MFQSDLNRTPSNDVRQCCPLLHSEPTDIPLFLLQKFLLLTPAPLPEANTLASLMLFAIVDYLQHVHSDVDPSFITNPRKNKCEAQRETQKGKDLPQRLSLPSAHTPGLVPLGPQGVATITRRTTLVLSAVNERRERAAALRGQLSRPCRTSPCIAARDHSLYHPPITPGSDRCPQSAPFLRQIFLLWSSNRIQTDLQ